MRTVYFELCFDKEHSALLAECTKENADTSLDVATIVNAVANDEINIEVANIVEGLLKVSRANKADIDVLEAKLKEAKKDINYPSLGFSAFTAMLLKKYASDMCDCPSCTAERKADETPSHDEVGIVLEHNLLASQEQNNISSSIVKLAEASSKVTEPKVSQAINDKILELLETI